MLNYRAGDIIWNITENLDPALDFIFLEELGNLQFQNILVNYFDFLAGPGKLLH